MDNKNNLITNILIIDETIREGMQYQGIMFSLEQRLRILDFQEKLKIDVCQAGYPSAHDSESQAVKTLLNHTQKNNYNIRIAAMGRANVLDAKIILNTGIKDLHFHVHIKSDAKLENLNTLLQKLAATIKHIKKRTPDALISIAMLDIGKHEASMLDHCLTFLQLHGVDILSLPDTSGILSPNQIFDKIHLLSKSAKKTCLSIHCHNDMGMASANGVMGIVAGARILEASALGIGERNGISDLYTTAKILKDQGFDIRIDTDNIETFKQYYQYVDAIVYEQTKSHLLQPNTPIFGIAAKTHVAGTHAKNNFGACSDESFTINVLCGKRLVKKYLDHQRIDFPDSKLSELTLEIKEKSTHLNRSLTLADINPLISSLLN